jgi:hypothetical protein
MTTLLENLSESVGRMESAPATEEILDLVTSNTYISTNLSLDKTVNISFKFLQIKITDIQSTCIINNIVLH